MKEKVKETAQVIMQNMIAPDVYDLWIQTKEAAELAVPGQFVSLYCNSADKLLPRPISICEVNKENQVLRMVYRIAGKGTDEISKLKAGDTLEILGPIGNGFPIQEKKALLIGGGIGVPPMLELAKQLKGETQIVLGYRDRNLFLYDEFMAQGDVYVATDDGSVGTHGTVIDAIKENNIEADVIYACGPKPMLRALQTYAKENEIECYISLEERMACGIGACLACVCKTHEKDAHSNVNNTRICKDGPVFRAEEVDLS